MTGTPRTFVARRLARAAASVLVAAGLLGHAIGQARQTTPGAQPPTFRTGISLVRVDVTATGRDDEVVADLEPKDFELREDDVVQKIEAFQFVRLTGEPVPGDDMSLPIRSRDHGEAEAARDDVRVFCVFLDDYHISEDIATTQRLRQALTSWLETGFKPTDVLVLMDPLTPISALDYTRSVDPIIEKIRKFKGRRGVYIPVRSALEEGQLQSRNPVRIRAEVTLTALNAIVTHLGALRERRTSVVFVSEGPRLFFSDANIEDRMRDVLEAANRFNVTINVVDPRGLTSGPPADSLWRLSAETGGRAVVNTNGLEDGLAQVVTDASAYYLLGYTPTREGDDGKYHKISVKSLRKGVRLLSRKGYWAPSEKDKALAPAPVVPSGVTEALGVFGRTEGGQQAITWLGFEPATASVTRVLLSWLPRRAGAGAVTPAALVLTVETAGLDTPVIRAERIALVAPDKGESGVPALTRFEIPPGAATLTLQLESADGEVIDRWTEKIQVPTFEAGATRIGTPRLLLAQSALALRALLAEPEAAVPTPRRDFRRTDRVVVRLTVAAPAGTGKATDVSAILLNRDGRELVTLGVEPGDAAGVARLELPLANLAAGDYVLKIEGRDAADRAPQHVAFRVVP